MYNYYGINLLLYKPSEIKAIKNRIDILINQVYFAGPNNNIIFDIDVTKNDLYRLNRKAAERLIDLFDRSPIKFILKKKDMEIMRFNLKRENLIQGIKIIQDIKGINKN